MSEMHTGKAMRAARSDLAGAQQERERERGEREGEREKGSGIRTQQLMGGQRR
jgi:hypothetical protein